MNLRCIRPAVFLDQMECPNLHRIATILLCCIALLGCGVDMGEIAPKGTERTFADGRVYILNNIRPSAADRERVFYVTYDGIDVFAPHNTTYDGEPTLVGAVPLTADPLPGGTQLEMTYTVEELATVATRNLSKLLGGPLTVDGDVTIEFYISDWEGDNYGLWLIQAVVRVIPGKYDGQHDYR